MKNMFSPITYTYTILVNDILQSEAIYQCNSEVWRIDGRKNGQNKRQTWKWNYGNSNLDCKFNTILKHLLTNVHFLTRLTCKWLEVRTEIITLEPSFWNNLWYQTILTGTPSYTTLRYISMIFLSSAIRNNVSIAKVDFQIIEFFQKIAMHF